ncbi:MAG: leucine-rich repeat protein [Lachnospiraceae bacterium]
MYRRLKNILGASLMALAVVISQIPMPEAQAVVMKEMTEAELEVDDASAHVVTFSMNGGTFRGDYNDYRFQDKTPVLVIDDGKKISSFPDDKYASYSGYKTEADTWYTDKECLTKYDADGSVTESITLYKKWYNITSDGTTLAPEGFYISADGTVLYRYDGKETLVEIPAAVTTIADGAFENLAQEVRGIKLPAGIGSIGENAFRGIQDGRIVYLYDSATDASREYGKQLASQYGQLVYSDYLDLEKTEEIVGINYPGDTPQEEAAETSERVRTTAGETDDQADNAENRDNPSDGDSTQNDKNSSDGNNTQNDSEPPEGSGTKPTDEGSEPSESDTDSTGEGSEPESGSTDSTDEGSKPSEDSTEPSDTDSDPESPEETDTSPVVVVPTEPKKYTVTFDTGISGVSGEKREVVSDNTISEEVSVDGNTARILRIGSDQIRRSEGGQEVTYTFRGWFKDNECTVRWNFDSDVIRQNTTIYAKWDRETTKKTEKTNTVVFQMNGGSFSGTYNGTSYTDASSLTAKIAEGKGISTAEYPESNASASFRYSNYSTDSSWYQDKECLTAYTRKDSSGNDTVVKENLTLYKKWYHTSSGFTMNASDNVLYKYSGSVEKVTIPDSVTVIGSDAFASVGGISSIILPDNISVVKENAFSGINKISKDIIITGRTEKAQNVAKELASQYTRLVYEGGDAAQDNDAVVISKTASGSIKLGATISGNTGTAGTNTGTAAANNTSTTGTIVLGTGSTGTAAANNTSTTGTIVIGDDSADTADADTAGVRTATVSQPTTGSQSATASPGTVTSAQQDTSGSAASAAQRTETTQKQNATSASAPRSTQHIKDSTPKTGDPLQYRMLVVCAMFSVGVLLVLTGNGKKKRFSAS